MLDAEAARAFLEQSRSRFVQIALDWLLTREDPVDLLFVLSREVGQAFGPWDTFRYCALLGLTPAKSVRELGLDVLAEPLGPSRLPPVSEAFAIAHARAAWPGEEAPFAQDVLAALAEAPAEGPGAGAARIAAARVAVAARTPGGPPLERALEALAEALQGDARAASAELLELCAIAGDRLPQGILGALGATVRSAQQPDGGLVAGAEARRFRELATLRALGALTQAADGAA